MSFFMGFTYQLCAGISRGILALTLLTPTFAHAAEKTPVAIELLLALDASASMDKHEFDLQVQGIVAAFKDPTVLQAIKDFEPEGVAIGVTQWGNPGEARVIVPFTHITTEMEARAFAFLISRASRGLTASSTSIAYGIENGIDEIERNNFTGLRRTIDISGDGEDNSGADLKTTRDLADALGITVNGLAIESETTTLTQYYQTNVITGADSFVVRAIDFNDYGRAIREKLLRELRPLGS
jgi:hypothetical protein